MDNQFYNGINYDSKLVPTRQKSNIEISPLEIPFQVPSMQRNFLLGHDIQGQKCLNRDIVRDGFRKPNYGILCGFDTICLHYYVFIRKKKAMNRVCFYSFCVFNLSGFDIRFEFEIFACLLFVSEGNFECKSYIISTP